MSDPDFVAELTRLLKEAARRHHAAFIESDGSDPEWPLWYAGYLQARLWDAGGRVPTRSELTYLLIDAERAHKAEGGAEGWAPFYAHRMAPQLHMSADRSSA